MRLSHESDAIFLPEDNPAGNGQHASDSIEPEPLGQIMLENPTLSEPMIDGLVRKGEVANLISTSKSYKTYLILNLAICMALGRQWLDRFQCRAGRVLVIDLELQKSTITRRVQDIAKAMHVELSEISDRIEVIALRGRAATIDQVERIILGLPSGVYSAVIIDPLYKTYPDHFDENSNAQMTALYRRWERMAGHLDGALIIVHHGTKGNQSEKRVVDVGAGASAQSRSADCHIALREHETQDAIVFDCRVRSFPPAAPMVVRWEYPLWHRALDLDPSKLKTNRTARQDKPADTEPAEDAWTVERLVMEFITEDPQDKKIIVAKARQAGVKNRQIDDLLSLAIIEKRAFRWSFSKDRVVYFANIEQPITYDKKHGVK